jgi:gluconate 5-dehydrogenase
MRPEAVLISGTTSGLGRALLAHYSAQGAAVIAVNRRSDPELEARFPAVRFECVDVRSAEGIERLIESLAASDALPDLFILNAGINRVDNDGSFELAEFRAVMETNLFGVLHFIQPLTRFPLAAKPRHVVAIGSMASYVGNPYGLGYHASKRALSACFDVWSHMYSGTDLIFQQVLLGPVGTPIYSMADRFPAWVVRVRDAFSVPLDHVVPAISRFARSRKKRLFAPRRAALLYFSMWLAQRLIPGFFRGRRTLAGKSRRATADQPVEAPFR